MNENTFIIFGVSEALFSIFFHNLFYQACFDSRLFHSLLKSFGNVLFFPNATRCGGIGNQLSVFSSVPLCVLLSCLVSALICINYILVRFLFYLHLKLLYSSITGLSVFRILQTLLVYNKKVSITCLILITDYFCHLIMYESFLMNPIA